MKKFLVPMLVGLFVLAVVTPALTWEFAMRGEYEYRFKYFSRTGNSDLFGFAPAQDGGAGTFIGFAGPNIWATGAVVNVAGDNSNALTSTSAPVVITRGGFSRWGSDAHYSDNRFTLLPEIRLNPAIKVFGVYTIGGYRNKYAQWNIVGIGGDPGVGTPPFERSVMQGVSQNAYDTAGIGSWEQIKFSAQTPIGTLFYGIRDFAFGLGATLGYNTRTEAFLAVIPYGPLSFLYAIWLSQGAAPFMDGWNQSPDGGRKNSMFQGFWIIYSNADLQFGAGWIGRNIHLGRGDLNFVPAFVPVVPGAPVPGEVVASDRFLNFWIAYLSYNNGRFFANAEYSWIALDFCNTLNGGPTAASPVLSQPRYMLKHAFAETGLLCGPARLTFMWAWSPGQNQINPNNGILPAGTLTTNSLPYPINYQAMEPYNTLMFYTYGGGNNQFNWTFGADSIGCMGDAWAFGTRLDYAVASNLNLWGTYLWAERLERDGYLAGQFGGVTAADPISVRGNVPIVVPGSAFRGRDGRGDTVLSDPFASNRSLGWEVNAGADWKLFEGMTLRVKYAYWQPGSWFDWAYQAIVPTGGGGVDVAPVGKNGIQSVQMSTLINF
ncbi:MAG TPA: hypothetical protein VMC85_13045 [Desulfomonilaceae bacterium]|nr:hypothetical protein [Desulfomonilaceae bacterium]HVN77801.1 hypothetical protein [Terriglobia bacterium]